MSQAFAVLCLAATALCVLVLVLLLWEILWQGLPWLTCELADELPVAVSREGGHLPALVSSLWLIGLTALFSVPIGVGAAVYLEEYAQASRWRSLVQLNIANLAGVPSIVYGILGLGLFVRALALAAEHSGRRADADAGRAADRHPGGPGSRCGRCPIRSARRRMRWARRAGKPCGTRCCRRRLPGIMTGVILAISRALGEAAPLVAIGRGDVHHVRADVAGRRIQRAAGADFRLGEPAASRVPPCGGGGDHGVVDGVDLDECDGGVRAVSLWKADSVVGDAVAKSQPAWRLAGETLIESAKLMQDTTIDSTDSMPVRPPSFPRERPMRTADDLAGRTPKISVEHLNFYYGAKQALSDVSLSIPQHCVTALIGPSGCGKSTFLRCLNRMNDMIDGTRVEGEILLDGQRHPAARRSTSSSCASASAWCFRSRTRFPSRSSRTWRTGRAWPACAASRCCTRSWRSR